MARLPIENPEAQKRTLLGGALSFEFPDCSIAAADLSKIASELIVDANKDAKRESKYVIGDGYVPERLVYAPVDYVDYYNAGFSLYGQPTTLVLAQHVRTQELTSERRERKWLIPRRVSYTERSEELTDIPFLAVTVGGDTILPIASFARRDGGQCSYVQLGQEMYDDNFYVTTADDETVRHALIEALREQVDSGSKHRLKASAQRTGIIQHFIDTQSEVQKSSLAQAYEQQLIRKSIQRFDEHTTKTVLLTTIGEAKSSELYDTSTLIPPCILDDGRLVSLLLARPAVRDDKWTGDRISLFAVTRNVVAAELASMSSQSMQFELSEVIDVSPDDRERIIRDLVFQIIARKPIKDIEVLEFAYESPNLKDIDRQIAQYLCDEDMLGEYEKHRSRDDYPWIPIIKIESQVRRQLDTFFAYPDPSRSPFPNSAPLKLALIRLGRQQKHDREILNRLQAGKIFAENIGEGRRCDEVLMHFVGRLALVGKELGAVFKSVQIGKTKAGAIVAASVFTYNGVFELSIAGRPESMPYEPMKPLISVDLNPVLPRLGQEKSNGAFSEEGADELIDIVSGIMSVNS